MSASDRVRLNAGGARAYRCERERRGCCDPDAAQVQISEIRRGAALRNLESLKKGLAKAG